MSNFGRLRNAKTKHVYSLCPGGIGYLQICTKVFGKNKNIKAHKAVSETFIPNPDKKRCVNHKDGDKFNNRVKNLEWATHQENSKHAVRCGLIVAPTHRFGDNEVFNGENNGMAKLNNDKVAYIRDNYIKKSKGNKYGNCSELAEMFGVSADLIRKVYKRKIWTHI